MEYSKLRLILIIVTISKSSSCSICMSTEKLSACSVVLAGAVEDIDGIPANPAVKIVKIAIFCLSKLLSKKQVPRAPLIHLFPSEAESHLLSIIVFRL
jgi:hypothetical protein